VSRPIFLTWRAPDSPCGIGIYRCDAKTHDQIGPSGKRVGRHKPRRDVPKAEVHVLDAGHFALDTAADQIAQLVLGFMK
jgi:hypothetical protein